MGSQLYQAIVDGILGGGVYALMAVGLTLIFGVLDIINIAQGILVVLGGLPQLRALRAPAHRSVRRPADHVPVMFAHRDRDLPGCSSAAARPGADLHVAAGQLRGRDHHRGRSCTWAFGPNYVNAERLVRHSQRARVRVLPALHLPVRVRLAVLLVAGALLACCTGPSSAAASGPPCRTRRAARLIGIDVNRVAALTFGIGVAVTAVGGMVFGATNAASTPTADTT